MLTRSAGRPPVRRTEVVVVGAGPAGLLLAGELRLGGAEVVVLEREPIATTESRASTLHARTMELLDARGLLERFGAPPNEPRGHFAGLPLDLSLPSRYPGQWKVLQARTEQVLQDWARSLGAQIHRGWTVQALTQRDHGVDVVATGPDGERLVSGRYVVACDGEDSTVRRITGAAFPGQDAGRELLRADVAGIRIPDRRFERHDRGLAVAARRGDGVTRVMVHEFGSTPQFDGRAPELRPDDFGSVVAAWRRVTGEHIGTGKPLWVNAFGDAARQLTNYRQGRLFFAGDAAHRQMPIGGQALNLALQDAMNLGWKLARRLRDDSAEPLLESYHVERHAVGKAVLNNIRAQAALLLGGPEVDPVRRVLGELLAFEDVRRHLAGAIAGLDISYGPGPGRLGTRLPVLPLVTSTGPTTTSALLRAGRGVLLGVNRDDEQIQALRESARPWAPDVEVVPAELDPAGADPVYGGADLDGVASVLVRPDGYLAWIAADTEPLASSVAGLQMALGRWFGRRFPAPSTADREEPADAPAAARRPFQPSDRQSPLRPGPDQAAGFRRDSPSRAEVRP